MKKRIKSIFVLLLIVVIPILESCKKYPDGPLLSLKSRAERVANVWKVENYKINGSDYTSLVSGYSETFSKNGGYGYFWGILSGSGNWAFQSNDTKIKLTGNDDHSSRTLFIQKLEEKSFWYYYMDGDDKYELHLVPM